MKPNNILISGGTGMVGQALVQHLRQEGFDVGILTRNKNKGKEKHCFQWNVDKHEVDLEALRWADAIIHLAGAGIVDKPWTEKRKKEILESRVVSSRLLIDAIKKESISMPVFITASAIGYYGADTGTEPVDEDSPAGGDFLGQTTKTWEEELLKADLPGTRKVAIRIGIVLSKKGGALPKMAGPVKYGLGAPLGSGAQLMSWVHIHDLCRIFQTALEHKWEGPYNAVSAVESNADFTKKLAGTLKKPLFLPPVPPFIMRLILGKRATLVLGGSNVRSKRLTNEQFSFEFSNIETALKNIYGK